MKKNPSLVIIAMFLAIICTFSVVSAVMPDREFSPNENRFLQLIPDFSYRTLFDGSFTADLSDYFSDQVFLRDHLTQLKSAVQYALGNRDIGGVYLASDKYLFEKITDDTIDIEKYGKNLEYVKGLSERSGVQTKTMLVPDAAVIYSEKLPKNASIFNSSELYEQAYAVLGTQNITDLREAFLSDTQQLYYKTDHHWTSHAAYLAYSQWSRQEGYTPKAEDDFGFTVSADDFRGSLYSKVLLNSCAYDSVTLPTILPALSVSQDGEKADGCFDKTKLAEKDKYAVFFGGNYGIVNIESEQQNGRRLLIIKDSFANCFAPLVAGECEMTTMIDLRYFNDSVSELIASGGYNEILVLYGLSSFANENLFKLAL